MKNAQLWREHADHAKSSLKCQCPTLNQICAGKQTPAAGGLEHISQSLPLLVQVPLGCELWPWTHCVSHAWLSAGHASYDLQLLGLVEQAQRWAAWPGVSLAMQGRCCDMCECCICLSSRTHWPRRAGCHALQARPCQLRTGLRTYISTQHHSCEIIRPVVEPMATSIPVASTSAATGMSPLNS